MNLGLKVVCLVAVILAVAEAGGRRGPKGKPCRWTDSTGAYQTASCYPAQYFTCESLPQAQVDREGNSIEAVCMPQQCSDTNPCQNGAECLSRPPRPSADDIAQMQQCFPDEDPFRPTGGRGPHDDDDEERPNQPGRGNNQQRGRNNQQPRGNNPQTGGNNQQQQRGGNNQQQGGNNQQQRPQRRNRRQAQNAPVPRCALPVQAVVASQACSVNGQSRSPCRGEGTCSQVAACTVSLNGQQLSLGFCDHPEGAEQPNGGNRPNGNPPTGNPPTGNPPNGNPPPSGPIDP